MAEAPVTLGLRVLITGGTSGVGLGLAQILANRSEKNNPPSIAACGRGVDPPPLNHSAIYWLRADLSKQDEIESVWAEAEKALGGIDVLVLSAGVGELGAVEDTPEEVLRSMFEVNLFSQIKLIKLALPAMRQRGHGVIVVMGSIVTGLQFPFKAQYCATKAAITAFALSLRHEVLPYGIRVHVLEPGWIRSAFHARQKPRIRPDTPYGSRLGPFMDHSRDADPNVVDGIDVAKIILAVLENPNAPARQAVGKDAKLFFFIARLLPYAWIDALVRRKVSQKK